MLIQEFKNQALISKIAYTLPTTLNNLFLYCNNAPLYELTPANGSVYISTFGAYRLYTGSPGIASTYGGEVLINSAGDYNLNFDTSTSEVDFTYTGNWRWYNNDASMGIIELYSNGTYIPNHSTNVDVWMCGGGGGGGESTTYPYYCDTALRVGGGGGGGYTTFITNKSINGNTNVPCIIGAGGTAAEMAYPITLVTPPSDGGTTSITLNNVTYSAQGGKCGYLSGAIPERYGHGGNGGSGGGGTTGWVGAAGGSNGSNGSEASTAGGWNQKGIGQQTTTYMFEDITLTLYCGGGGGGGYTASNYPYGVGGAGGGGRGGYRTNDNAAVDGENGTLYGGGGGGATSGTRNSSYPHYYSGAGYQGVIFIRAHIA